MESAGFARGERFGRYELVRRLGTGGMAEVFLARLAREAGFEKTVVLKRTLPEHRHEESFLEMFLDEARLAAKLAHPNICQVFDLGRHDDRYFIAMEYVPGQTLTSLLARFREQRLRLPMEAALRIAAQLCEALHYAHNLGDDEGRPFNIVHRDVTPSNVMITPQGSVKLLDFGIAHAADRQHQTRAGVAKGKLGYMAPEQASAQPMDRRTDLFAVGTVLYILSTGRHPYLDATPRSEVHRAMREARFPRPREVSPELAPELERIILKAMAKEPKARYAQAFELLRDLEGLATAQGLSMGPRVLTEMGIALEQPAEEISGSTAERASYPEPWVEGTDQLTGDRRGFRPEEETRADPGEQLTVLLPGDDRAPRAEASEATLTGKRPAPAARRRPRPSVGTRALKLLSVSMVALGMFTLAGYKLMPRLGPEPLVEPVIALPDPVPSPRAPAPGPTPAPAAAAPDSKPPEAAPEDAVSAVASPEPPEHEIAALAAPVVKPPARTRVGARPGPAAVSTANGFLDIQTEPSASVKVLGRTYGRSPVRVVLPAGTHRVILEYSPTLSHTREVQIRGGRSTRLTDRMH